MPHIPDLDIFFTPRHPPQEQNEEEILPSFIPIPSFFYPFFLLFCLTTLHSLHPRFFHSAPAVTHMFLYLGFEKYPPYMVNTLLLLLYIAINLVLGWRSISMFSRLQQPNLSKKVPPKSAYLGGTFDTHKNAKSSFLPDSQPKRVLHQANLPPPWLPWMYD